MDFINPIQPIQKNDTTIKKRRTPAPNHLKKRATRSDKTHNIKFPVTPIEQMKLKSYCRQTQRLYKEQGKEPISQTKFNNRLLRFGLKNQQIINWNGPYTDSKVYMHTNILETEYTEIGGPHGLAVRKNLSERKVVYYIVISVIKWLEGGEGSLEKII